jgi:hypothetical protein
MTRRHGLVVGVAAAVMMAAGVITGTVAVVSITAAAKDRETRGDRRIAGIVAVADIVIRVRIVVANAGITRCRITHTCDGVAVGVNHTRGEGETADGGTG